MWSDERMGKGGKEFLRLSEQRVQRLGSQRRTINSWWNEGKEYKILGE